MDKYSDQRTPNRFDRHRRTIGIISGVALASLTIVGGRYYGEEHDFTCPEPGKELLAKDSPNCFPSELATPIYETRLDDR